MLMQFDPGMEYRPDWGSSKVPNVKGAPMNPQSQGHNIQRGSIKGMPPQGNAGLNKGPPVGPKDDKS